jgi:hypothetical protein
MMFIRPTALIYSSHDRCDYIHRQWLVQRALESHHNKTIFYLPFSMERRDQQEYSWGTFRYYFERFRKWGLVPQTFFWTDSLSKRDAETFFDMVSKAEVLILGGGSHTLGKHRYDLLGRHYFGDAGLFGKLLHRRQAEGKLTAGFSAGAIQLADRAAYGFEKCYALIHNVAATLHHEWGGEGELRHIAGNLGDCLVFGLPNDSGLASNQGVLGSGNKWQILQFIIDNSWDVPDEQFHIKSRQGMRIEHYYRDGRKWTFNGGDMMVRVFSPDYRYQGAWILQPHNPVVYDYWTQRPSGYRNVQHILASH